jgi:uncharacterized protein
VTAVCGPPQTLSMHTRDSVRLDADVYRPDAPGRFPVLLMRQPYGRRIASTVCYAHPRWYAAQGFVVVIQDVRGRGSSEGEFNPFVHEAADGADSVTWAAALPGTNGNVGMYGFSYQGTAQLLAAAQAGPALKALAPAMIGWDLRTDWAYTSDAFCLHANLGWATQVGAETARLAGNAAAFAELYAASRALPLNGARPARPDLIERHARYTHYHAWLAPRRRRLLAIAVAIGVRCRRRHPDAVRRRMVRFPSPRHAGGVPALYIGGDDADAARSRTVGAHALGTASWRH